MAIARVTTLFIAVVFSSHLVSGEMSQKVQTFSKVFADSISAKKLSSFFDFSSLTGDQIVSNYVDNVLDLYDKYGIPTTAADRPRILRVVKSFAPYLNADDWIKLFGDSVGSILSDNGVLKQRNAASLANEFANFIDYVNKFKKDDNDPVAKLKVFQEAYVSYLFTKNLFNADKIVSVVKKFNELALSLIDEKGYSVTN